MKFHFWVFVFTFIIILIFAEMGKNDVVFTKNQVNGNEYLVRNLPDKNQASMLLAQIHSNINKLTDYLYKNINNYKDHKKYIINLYERTRYLILKENVPNSSYTTYTLNKGEEMVCCLRSKKNGKLHDLNLLMFVAIHELAHIGCPEQGHTALFINIFTFFLKVAIDIKIYNYQDYHTIPTEYCGMELNETPV
jgi:hypothetical protein